MLLHHGVSARLYLSCPRWDKGLVASAQAGDALRGASGAHRQVGCAQLQLHVDLRTPGRQAFTSRERKSQGLPQPLALGCPHPQPAPSRGSQRRAARGSRSTAGSRFHHHWEHPRPLPCHPGRRPVGSAWPLVSLLARCAALLLSWGCCSAPGEPESNV